MLTVGARTGPISSSLREVSTWREQIARSKKTPALQATLKYVSPPTHTHTHTHTHTPSELYNLFKAINFKMFNCQQVE